MIPPLTDMLTAFWIASTCVYVVKPFSPRVSHILTYGKTASEADKRRWGPGRIPTYVAWRSFYLLGLTVWAATVLYPVSRPSVAVYLVGLHLLRRVGETWFVHIYSPAHVGGIHVLAGCAYYVAMPLTVAVSSSPSPPGMGLAFGLGLPLFAVGSGLQAWTHLRLRWARTEGTRGPGRTDRYVSLQGGVFHVWASPHYVGEVVLYVGLWMVMGGGGLLGTTMVLFVAVNLWDKASAASRFVVPPAPQPKPKG